MHTAATSTTSHGSLDLELIAQRIVKLAEIATLEHIESLMNSQAEQMLIQAADAEAH